jgi:hypothetical protein
VVQASQGPQVLRGHLAEEQAIPDLLAQQDPLAAAPETQVLPVPRAKEGQVTQDQRDPQAQRDLQALEILVRQVRAVRQALQAAQEKPVTLGRQVQLDLLEMLDQLDQRVTREIKEILALPARLDPQVLREAMELQDLLVLPEPERQDPRDPQDRLVLPEPERQDPRDPQDRPDLPEPEKPV